MTTQLLQVYEPPMCCSSGVCGPKVDPALVQFSTDLDWFRKQDVTVERFNLSSHPAEFAKQGCVREALAADGNDCLPLILVNGAIVARGNYPAREALARFLGMEVPAADSSPVTPASDTTDASAACGPGCNCNSGSAGKGAKTIISLLVLAAVAAILSQKAMNPSCAVSTVADGNRDAGFSIAAAAEEPAEQPLPDPDQANTASEASATVEKAKTEVAAPVKIGDYLETLVDLNKVAISQDAVFIFIPDAKDKTVKSETNDAVLAAQRTLKKNRISVGLYTLPATSGDYANIAKQTQTPAILVATKGRGMTAVSGKVTAAKILQAFMSTCGPSGCGPSGCN